MFEKVNPAHPDKIADRIAGAIVDLAYQKEPDPKMACEVLIGHGKAFVITETDVDISRADVERIIQRLAGYDTQLRYSQVPQDYKLAQNQSGKIRCGDNGIFKGAPMTEEQRNLTKIAKALYERYKTDGKYFTDGSRRVICQSRASSEAIRAFYPAFTVNPIGDWLGGLETDSGATNRKLGSDMGDGAIGGGGLHGKDLSKADVSVNIYAFLKAQETGEPVELSCSIGDEMVDGLPYSDIVEIAGKYINELGGFEKLAEWGLIR